NGKGFDHPLLATRYRLAGLTDPFASLNHLDLLHPTRSAFASRWPDCRLQSAERRLLGFNRSGDLPGSEVPDAWFSWVRHGDVGRLPSLLEHNYQDVVSLAILLHRLHTCFTQPRKYGADILAIARNRQRLCDSETAQELLKENRSYLDQKGLLELARLSRRQGKTELAREIWGELTRQSNLEAMEYLAKDYEHTLRDPFEALRITRLMLEITGDDPAHRHRERRLLAKIRSSKDVKPLPKC
ncbi:MAG: hypothetical protein GY731_04820, partial [Gammaproteobacteria bacterium]|nr:hypothetical protein [Gammaproteobacteria bacterium]